jgi:hypothetical protein
MNAGRKARLLILLIVLLFGILEWQWASAAPAPYLTQSTSVSRTVGFLDHPDPATKLPRRAILRL